MQPTKLLQRKQAEPVKAEKWINLHFDIHGKSYRGEKIYNSPEEAELGSTKGMKEYHHRRGNWVTPDGKFPKSEYLYSIPMPIKGE